MGFNVNSIKFRCSSLGHLFTEPRSKTEELSETTKAHLIDVWASAKYGIREDFSNKYTQKGNLVEDDSITELSVHYGIFFKKNTQHFENDFIKGTPDIDFSLKNYSRIIGKERIIDTKSSFSLRTFMAAKRSKIDKDYFYQGFGYCYLTGLRAFELVYILCNSPAYIIEDEKRKAMYMHRVEFGSDDYQKLAAQIERNHIFDFDSFIRSNENYNFDTPSENLRPDYFDIPREKRIHSTIIEWSDLEFEQLVINLHNKINTAKTWILNNLEN